MSTSAAVSEAAAPSSERGRRRRVGARMMLAVAVCVLALVVLTAVFVETRAGQRIDNGALRGRVVEHPLTAQRSEKLLRTISVGSLLFFGMSLMGIALVRGQEIEGNVVGEADFREAAFERLQDEVARRASRVPAAEREDVVVGETGEGHRIAS